jgi:transposase
MPKKRFSAEQIVVVLRQIEVLMSQGKTAPVACREAGISQQSYYRWRKEYGGLEVDQAKRMKELERENVRLKRLVADLSLENFMGGRPLEGLTMRRYALRDDRIKDFLPGREGHVGGTAADNRLFVEAVLYRYRAGIPWRDLPERIGDRKIVHQRFGRCAKSGVLERIFKLLASDHDNEYMMIDANRCARSSTQRPSTKKPASKRSADRAEDRGAGPYGKSDPRHRRIMRPTNIQRCANGWRGISAGTFHFTPTSASWLNAVEGFFAKLTRQRLKRGVFRSVIDLQVAINRFVAETNPNLKPFVWTADPKRVLAAVKRGKPNVRVSPLADLPTGPISANISLFAASSG